ncbi:hypothetical protein [Aquabacter cavernae]|uniref:hypothetical protein n=1 Tax=Aquabacter cavernae TaxID=2496029 RepID=UPI000F8D4395|nr:hypothetical protein [Aquabacter cavernae]
MSGPLDVVLVHSMPGRLRLRLARAPLSGIEAVAAELSGRPGVLKVAYRAETGSLLVLHDGRFRPEADPALRLVPARPGGAAPSRTPGRGKGLGGGVAGAAAFSGLALLQMARGRVLPPALTLVWYAVSLLKGLPRKSGG